MCQHVLQEIEFFRRESGLTLSDKNSAQVEIDFDVIESNHLHLIRKLRGSPERGADTSQQLGRAERLGYIVVGARVQRLDLVGFRITNGEHDYGNIGGCPDDAASLQTVHAGHVHIENNEI